MIAILRSGKVVEAPTVQELFKKLEQIGDVPRAIVIGGAKK